jgi:dolichol-phosphate mannosyltransferase
MSIPQTKLTLLNPRFEFTGIPGVIWLLAGGFLLLTATYGMMVPLNGDEALYWQHGRHLDWGFYTHPPMTGFLIRVSTFLLGDTLLGIRLISSLLGTGTLLLLYRLAWESTESRQIAFYAVLIYCLFPLMFGLGVAMVTDVPLLFFHTAAVYFVRKALIDAWKPGWLLAGLMIGLMMQSKFLGALLIPGLALFVLIHPQYRKCLLQAMPYMGALVSLLVFSPVLLWGYQNGWINLEFQFRIRTRDYELDFSNLWYYLSSIILVYTPVVVIALALILPKHWKPCCTESTAEMRQQGSLNLLAWLHFGILGGYLLLSMRYPLGAHWLAFLQPLSAILLAEGLSRLKAVARRAWYWWASLGTVSLLMVGMPIYLLLLAPKLLPPEQLYLPEDNPVQRAVSNYFGWEEVGVHIARLKDELAVSFPNLFLSSSDYSLASVLSFYTPGHPDFALFNYENSKHGREYLGWSRPLMQNKGNTLMVSDSPNTHQELLPHYQEVSALPTLEIRDQNGLLRVFYFHLGKGFKSGN